MLPTHLILNIIKLLEIKTIIDVSLINKDSYIIYLNNKEYIGKIKFIELGLKGSYLYIYNKIKCLIEDEYEHKRIIYTEYCSYCEITYNPNDYDNDYAMCWTEKEECGCCGFQLDANDCPHLDNSDSSSDIS